eukprot:CAMPEP_0118918014 /NCGR_PEP_ID=MMETSP1166-20130328/17657_1 /TAXON_ID=1104430 /ORGANISM="Chrysoreinhardia sp, Strain CCMP3193" /LENGTH=1280 /DNA_ID=CAMNT_0006858253 /DNA_START=19 /DNA_END=3861 /DNA_ORIENTATION=-
MLEMEAMACPSPRASEGRSSESEARSWHSTAYSQIVHGEHPRKEEGSDANSVFKFATTFRRLSFCVLFATNLLWLLLTIAFALGGLDPINDRNIGEVGLNMPEDEYQLRANAYQQAKDEADLTLTVGKCLREDPVDPIQLFLMKGSFARRSRGNALSKGGLETLRSRENKILAESGWESRCNRLYTDSYPACHVDLGANVTNGDYVYLLADARGCRRPFSPVLFFEKYGDPEFRDIPGTVHKIRDARVDWRAFQDMLHKDFRVENMRSKILVSEIYAGTPRRNVSEYVSQEDLGLVSQGLSISWYSDTHEEKEFDHLSHWIEANLGSWLDRQFRETPYRTLYSYAGYDPVDDRVLGDLLLLFASIIFIIAYLWYYTGSLFITCCGIFQIFTSFFGANLIYRYCWPTPDGLGYNYFTLFCALALFIIMGIGADDLFVYWDTWLGSATHAYKTVAHRTSHVYSHAASAMAVTSATTVLAFLSNLSSPFIGIRTFGIFSALLVIVNYLAVATFFPVAVLVYDVYFDHQAYWCGPLCASCWTLFIAGHKEDEEAHQNENNDDPDLAAAAAAPLSSDDDDDDDARINPAAATATMANNNAPRAIYDLDLDDDKDDDPDDPDDPDDDDDVDRASSSSYYGDDDDDDSSEYHQDYTAALPIWFRDRYAPFLVRRQAWIIVASLALWGTSLYFAIQLEATPFKAYELLPATENFHQVTFVDENWRTKTSNPLFVHVLYGLDHRRPLSLHGVKPQNFVSYESGDPQWDDTFDMDAIDAQLQLHRTAEEFWRTPRRGLKIERAYGINPQLFGSATGSLEDTPDQGAQSSVVVPYGIQSFIHALETWENASVASSNGSYVVKENFESSCKPCFDAFAISPAKNAQGEFIDPDTKAPASTLRLNATANLNARCNCYGYFPIATEVCLFETRDSPETTLFKCAEQDDGFAYQIGNFLQAAKTSVDENWWVDYVFALADSYGRYVRVALYDVQVMTVLSATEGDFKKGLDLAKKWDDWMDDANSNPANPLKVMAYVPNSNEWAVDARLVPSGVTNMVLSLFLAWVVLVFSTGNWITASIATITIGMICTIVLGCIQVLGWGLGAIESILVVIVVGFSVDYTVHLADSYMASRSVTREDKVVDALVHTGSSVLSGAISTVGASVPMFFARIIFFQKFGAFVFITIVLSLFYSLGFFSAVLVRIGPLGKAGNLSNFYAGLVESMHAHIRDLEVEQRLLDEHRRNTKPHGQGRWRKTGPRGLPTIDEGDNEDVVDNSAHSRPTPVVDADLDDLNDDH